MGFPYNDLLILRHCHLIYDNDNLNVTYKWQWRVSGGYFYFGDKLIVITHDFDNEYTFGQIAFTPAGTELLNIMNVKPNYKYLENFIKEKEKLGFHFREADPDELLMKKKTDKD